MKRYPTALLLAACIALAAPHAAADRIWFKATDRPEALPEGAPAPYLEGKIVEETGDHLVLRIEGGTITVDRRLVSRVERTPLTLRELEEREATMREALVEADRERRRDLAQWAEAAVRLREEERRPQEMRIEVSVDFHGILPPQLFRFYSPILHRIDMDGLAAAIEAYLRAEVRRLSRQ